MAARFARRPLVGTRLVGTRKLPAIWVLSSLLVVAAGCGQSPITPVTKGIATEGVNSAAPVADNAPKEPAQVELFDDKVRIDDAGVFYFDVKYRFTKGAPRQFYLVTVKFPGTNNLCLKRMEAWELKAEGQIKDGIPLFERPITAYEITLSEADSPMNEYKLISNSLPGTWPPAK